MARIRLVEQEAYEFHYTVTLQPRDINYGGHLSNDAVVSLAGSARAGMFHCLGISELNLGDEKTGIIMADLAVNYKTEGYMFDKVTIDVHIGELISNGFRVFHRFKREDDLIALVEAGMITYNYNLKKIAAVPEIFLKLLTELKTTTN